MGKGDRKTRRGKIVLGTYGKLRPRRKKFSVRPKTVKGSEGKGT
ncbi:MAG: 30S ribosomal protein THX [Marinirhabdus sp.]